MRSIHRARVILLVIWIEALLVISISGFLLG